jgi:hypothetical protein
MLAPRALEYVKAEKTYMLSDYSEAVRVKELFALDSLWAQLSEEDKELVDHLSPPVCAHV